MEGPVAPRVAGVVLAGGASRRMGADKALIEVDGRALVVTACNALRAAGVDPVVVVGGDPQAGVLAGVRTLPDRWPGEGPLGGIVTALGHLDDDGVRPVLVLACDLPDASPATVGAILDRADGAGDSVILPVLEGVPQWLHALWPPGARPVLAEAFEAGERAPWRAGRRLPVVEVADLDPDSLRDLDRPEDLGERAARGPGGRHD